MLDAKPKKTDFVFGLSKTSSLKEILTAIYSKPDN